MSGTRPGGIRCERATALVNQMASASSPDTFQPLGVYELQGGIERYLKTFPQGGLWKGKNYLFDRRMEQVPAEKPLEQVESECARSTTAAAFAPTCVVCHGVCTQYRGQFHCSTGKSNSTSTTESTVVCGVPVIVCPACVSHATAHPETLQCPLCQEGYQAPTVRPNLVHMKQQAEQQEKGSHQTKKRQRHGTLETLSDKPNTPPVVFRDTCLFLSRLPLTVTRTKLEALLGPLAILHWLTDRRTNAFYGSCVVELQSVRDAKRAMEPSVSQQPRLSVDQKKFKVQYFRPITKRLRVDSEDTAKPTMYHSREDDMSVWPPVHARDTEYPPIGDPHR